MIASGDRCGVVAAFVQKGRVGLRDEAGSRSRRIATRLADFPSAERVAVAEPLDDHARRQVPHHVHRRPAHVEHAVDAENQRAVVRDALQAFESIETPGEIITLDYRWSQDDAWKAQSSDASTGDARPPRSTEPVYQTENDRVMAKAAGAHA